MRPSLLTKYVCSPNTSLSCGTIGWSSGMGSASNWPSVCSICVDVSFIALSPFGWFRPAASSGGGRPTLVCSTYVRSCRAVYTLNVRCSHTPSRDDGAFGGTPSASRRHALCRADILPVRTSTVADKWNCPWGAAVPPIVLSSLSRAVHRAKETVMTLARNLGALVLAAAWLLSVSQGTFSQANAQAQSPSPGPSDRTTAI